MNCGKNGPTERHNGLRDQLCHTLCAGGITFSKEVMVPGRTRPADILLHNWSKGMDVCVDLTITNPLQAENLPLKPDTAFSHLSQAERDKHKKHNESCEKQRWLSNPAAFSPWGGCGPAAKSLLRDLISRIVGAQHPAVRECRTREIRENLSLTLARHIAKQLSVKNRVLETLY